MKNDLEVGIMPHMTTDLKVGPMSPEAISNVKQLEDYLLEHQEQFHLRMTHILHAGLYSRTVLIPAGIVITGALVKIATVLIVQGDCLVLIDGEETRITGCAIMQAEAGRKQAFVAINQTFVTMAFATEAKTIAEAEAEFTDEADRLASRRDGALNEVIQCQE